MTRRYTNEGVVNAWYSGIFDKGQNQGNSLWFKGPRLCSYRTLIAYKAVDGTVLESEEVYSNTTAKHLNLVARVVPPSKRFKVENCNLRDSLVHRQNLEGYKENLCTALHKHMRARTERTRSLYESEAEFIRSQMSKYYDTFGLSYQGLELPTDEEIDFRVALLETKRKEEADFQRKIKKQEEEESAIIRQRWRDNEIRGLGKYRYRGDPMLRLVKDEGEGRWGWVESSQWPGLVNFHQAKRLWEVVSSAKSQGCHMSFDRNNSPVMIANFHLRIITKQGNIRIGCHHIKYGELERIAKQLGWI